MEPIEELQSQVEVLSKQYTEVVEALSTAADLLELHDNDLKHLKGRVDRNAENIVKIQKPGA